MHMKKVPSQALQTMGTRGRNFGKPGENSISGTTEKTAVGTFAKKAEVVGRGLQKGTLRTQ